MYFAGIAQVIQFLHWNSSDGCVKVKVHVCYHVYDGALHQCGLRAVKLGERQWTEDVTLSTVCQLPSMNKATMKAGIKSTTDECILGAGKHEA